MKRVLTGIKPTGDVHIGNYLGAIRPAIALQEEHEAYYFIADYHALTTVQDPERLRHDILSTAATWMALGLDPEKTVMFQQSRIPEVCELAWILACTIPVGQLDRGHAVKAARDGGYEANAGTLYYPVLMAADILMYDSEIVPVGRDQKQHVEIARDMSVKMNFRYGNGAMVVPEVAIRDEVAVVPGLDGRKMSKSYQNVIPLWAPQKQLRKIIMKIVTDSLDMESSKDPDNCNVFLLYKLFASPDQITDLAARYRAGGLGYGTAKQELFELIDAELTEPRERYNTYMNNPERILEVLEDGAQRARKAAMPVLERVRQRIGLNLH